MLAPDMRLITFLITLAAPAFCGEYSLQLTPDNTRIEWTLSDVLHAVHGTFELKRGTMNAPKTVLIAVTVPVMFVLPALPNLDTAFQGANAWHSFQYLVLTWHANRLRRCATHKQNNHPRSFSATSRSGSLWLAVRAHLTSLNTDTGWRTFYLVCFALVPVSGVLVLVARIVWPNLHAGNAGSDEVYEYMVVLSVLLVHYFHDLFLFSDTAGLLSTSEDRPMAPAGDRGVE